MEDSTVSAPKVLILGPSGSGKTYSLRTIVEAGLELFVIATEPGVANVLGDLPASRCHWNYIPPMPMSFDALIAQVTKINELSYEGLTKMTGSRTEFRQMLDLMNLFKDFKCQRTGQSFGDVTKWDNNRFLALDSMSGLTMMMINATIGTKPTMNQPEYGLVQTALERTVNSLCMTLTCGFAMTAHVEREFNETTGGITLMASTAGKKLAPKLPRFFDECVLARREGSNFFWSTASLDADTKARLLPLSDKLAPSFKPLIETWRTKAVQTPKAA